VHENRLVTGLAAAFAVMTAILAVGGLFIPPLFLPAILFGAVTYFIYYQASGRLLNRVYRGVERQAATESRGRRGGGRGGFGAGPREEWTPPREEQRRAGRQRVRQERVRQGGRQQGRRRRRQRVQQTGPTPREASQVLGVAVDADESTVKRAYRERIKEVHPDADDGDEEEFKRVQEAYEVLTD
jgi:Zn-dependent protease with chaperone function